MTNYIPNALFTDLYINILFYFYILERYSTCIWVSMGTLPWFLKIKILEEWLNTVILPLFPATPCTEYCNLAPVNRDPGSLSVLEQKIQRQNEILPDKSQIKSNTTSREKGLEKLQQNKFIALLSSPCYRRPWWSKLLKS